MSDQQFLTTELDDFDRALLGSADIDRPASGAVTRAAAALGIAAVAAPVAVAAAATGVAGRAATFSFTKWTLISALGVAGAGTGTVAYLGANRGVTARELPAAQAPVAAPARGEAARTVAPADDLPPAPPVAPTTVNDALPAAPGTVAAPAARRPAAAPLAAPATPSPAVAAFPQDPAPTAGPGAAPAAAATAPGATPAPAAANAAPAAAPGGAVSIAEEVALVDRARHALRQGRAGEAFDTLSLHQSRWPNGVLATEVRVLRVEALLRMGQRASAQRDARAFIAVQPNSRYAARLRELFAPGELD
jgi:hypothetical protein